MLWPISVKVFTAVGGDDIRVRLHDTLSPVDDAVAESVPLLVARCAIAFELTSCTTEDGIVPKSTESAALKDNYHRRTGGRW